MDTTRITLTLDTKYFPLPLDVRWLDGKRWYLLAPFEYHSDDGEVTRAKKGFITDFRSGGRIVTALIGSPTDEGGPAYVIHDWQCVTKPYSYRKIDRRFYNCLRDARVAYLKRTLMYWVVAIAHLI